ncbi:MAG TPA: site-2 protease family protein [Nitrospira sp.]|jgi:Zn-dependent protease|nr:site-2 protease family protein [Nitrospira sp.]
MSELPPLLYAISYKALPLLFAIVLHEYAHGWVADKCGDPTAKRQGRLTLNPLAHIDPFGTIIVPLLCLLLPGSFLLGWAKPVPIDPRNMRQPRRDMALVAAAGPGMNFVLAVGSAVLLAMLLSMNPSLLSGNALPDEERSIGAMILLPLAVMAFYSVLVNVFLGIFNLLPIPPLDGGRIMVSVLPAAPARALARLEPYGMMILVALLVFDRELRIIHTFTSTFASGLSGTILSTAVGIGAGTSP